MELAEQTGLSELIDTHVDLPSRRVASGAVNAAGKLTTVIAAMLCGTDSIDAANVLRAGGTPRVFGEVYAPSTVGIFLREFTFGHANQLAAVAREHLAALAARTALLPGIQTRAFLDIDSLLRPVYGHNKQGASFGHAKIARRARAAAQRALAAGHHLVGARRRAGDRRGLAAQRQDRFRARRGPPNRAGHHHRPRGRGQRGDHGARRLRLWHQESHRRLPR